MTELSELHNVFATKTAESEQTTISSKVVSFCGYVKEYLLAVKRSVAETSNTFRAGTFGQTHLLLNSVGELLTSAGLLGG